MKNLKHGIDPVFFSSPQLKRNHSHMNPNSVDVLLVEDNLDDAEGTIRELKRHHLANNLVHVKDGKEALEFLFSTGRFEKAGDPVSPPKVILLDIHMPKVNSFEVLRKIKSDKRTKTTPVVILTSSNEHPDIHKCYKLGANSYIVKPLNFERFMEAIRNLGFCWLLLNQPPGGQPG
jgi:two-component system, response regulator